MAHVTISEAQANALRALRALKPTDPTGYKDARRALFANMRQQYGVPDDIATSVEVDNTASPQYRVLKGRSRTTRGDYIPLTAGPDGRHSAAAAAAPPLPRWGALPMADAMALLREQAETMEGYTQFTPDPDEFDPDAVACALHDGMDVVVFPLD